ncbi:hypothetical protein predicted by Glimmer/Critica [Acetobacter ghanensis]|uniref:Uncharacterized protein n=1 Tax=Acetobacter ghanensis TaxID=431306 RepID=A0A0U5BGS3_9PROT|nr:hypothetical protein predicted by Glimmer/Critica [Acetobacter ghanensis]
MEIYYLIYFFARNFIKSWKNGEKTDQEASNIAQH